MSLYRSTLSALVLFAAMPVAGEASAEPLPPRTQVRLTPTAHFVDDWQGEQARVQVVGQGDSAAVTATISSDTGREDLVLVEYDAWLHGAATLAALPSEKASVGLTLYDTGSATLVSYSGVVIGGGSIVFTADAVLTCDTSSKLGCSSEKPPADVEVLAAELYPSEKGYDLALDLAGADTYAVAYAEIVVTEPWEVTDECMKDASSPLCGDTGHFRAEVDWDGVGSVWEADATLEHTGVIDVKVQTLDAGGETLENVHAELGEPWLDDGGGVNTLAASVSKGPQPPRLAMLCGRKACGSNGWGSGGVAGAGLPTIGIVSEGWTATSYPTHAELELAGDTATIPANSYQRMRKRPELLYQAWDDTLKDYISDLVLDPGSTISVTSGSFVLEGYSASQISTPVCSSGTCVVLVEGEDGYALSVTTYGESATKLPSKQDLTVMFHDKSGTKLASETITVEFDEEVVAVFANAVELVGDPAGLDASGGVSLLGAADTKGMQETLAKGTFHGSFSVDEDGDLGLGGYGTDDAAKADTNFAVLLGGSVKCGGDDYGCGGDWAPLVVAYRDRFSAYVVGVVRVSTRVRLRGAY